MNTGRHRIRIAGSVMFGIITIAPLIAIAATNSRLEGWRFSPDYQQLDFALSAPSQPKVFFLQQPPRLVVDLPNTKLGMVSTRQDYQGLVQRVRVSQLNATDTRIVMDLAPNSPFNPAQVQVQPLSATQWVIRPFVNAYNSQSQFLQTQSTINQPYPQGVFPPQPPINAPFNPPSPPSEGVYLPQPNGIPQPPVNPYLPPNSPVTRDNNFNNNSNQSLPMVVVPPIAPLNPPTGGLTNDSNLLPPPVFPNQNNNWNNPPLITPNQSSYQQNPTTVEWGQQLPSPSQ